MALAKLNCHQEPDFYWRDYYGTIPEDAIIAGCNQDGTKVYIGQGYLRNYGLHTGTITPGRKEISVHYFNVSQSHFNKILCGVQENFYWMRANASDLHILVIDKFAVNGGHDDPSNGILNIGRIAYGGTVTIGKIVSFEVGGALLYYNDNGVEKHTDSYEVLMYDGSTKIDPRSAISDSY